jgi:hypothetical protein
MHEALGLIPRTPKEEGKKIIQVALRNNKAAGCQ